jgi:hypothetical protein
MLVSLHAYILYVIGLTVILDIISQIQVNHHNALQQTRMKAISMHHPGVPIHTIM